MAGKIKDDIEEFGYGGALVRVNSDQEPAIDVKRAVIAKRETRNSTGEWKTQSRRFKIW